jgi:hypothetical protein
VRRCEAWPTSLPADPVRSLEILQSTSAGRSFLRQETIFDDPAAFLGRLKAPANRQSRKGKQAPERPVYVHQQVYLDYRASVVAKIAALRTLRDICSDILPAFLWIDTDRSGSDKLGLRLYLAGQHGRVPVRLAPAGCDHTEPRFIPTDPVRLTEAADRLGRMIRSAAAASNARLVRFEKLRPLIEAGGTLAELSRRLTDSILDETMAFRPHPVLVSGLIASGELTPTLEAILNRLPEFIATFNQRIRTLQALDVDPKVRPLAGDYLPLFMTFPEDGRRVRLRLVRDGGTYFACAEHPGGGRRCYELGRRELSLAQLDEHVRWSPDVTLPILVNERYSGMVGGKSSALYMLVCREVMRKVLDMVPIPLLVPSNWDVFPGAADSLLEAYLDGRSL